jgi:hypothetical protein
VDLGAEKTIAAEKGERKIAVEIKSFVGRSDIQDLESSLGQYRLYRSVLEQTEPGRTLYLSIPAHVLVYFESLLVNWLLSKSSCTSLFSTISR